MNESIRIFVTGGTFEKQYDAISGELTFADTHLPEILRQARVTLSVEVEILQLIDSLQMTENDRTRIREACASAVESQIIVIHGTDTMVDTAKVLVAADLGKTVVLTGAMIPFSVHGSDALFNLGGAMTAVQNMPAGVYIAMNGQVFPGDRVQKDRAAGRFVSNGDEPSA